MATTAPAITADPRFQLARALLSGRSDEGGDGEGEGEGGSGGGPAAAADIFAALHEQTCASRGDASLDAAICQYEYGNALFRAVVRRSLPGDEDGGGGAGEGKAEEEGEEEDRKPAARATAAAPSQREIMAAAALKRSAGGGDPNPSNSKRSKNDKSPSAKNGGPNDAIEKASTSKEPTEGGENDVDEDVKLALDMMETSFAIFIEHAEDEKSAVDQQKRLRQQWALGQLPRVLVCIGDLHSFRGKRGDALDAYFRALRYRDEEWERLKPDHGGDVVEKMTVEGLQCQRRLVETNALIAETLLECPNGEDVICQDDGSDEAAECSAEAKGSKEGEGPESGRVLVQAKEIPNFTQSYYEAARGGVEDIIYRVGKMKAARMELGNEMEDVGYLVMMVVGVGNALVPEKHSPS
ncbi:hypothetical protein ACHAWF_011632 [Thalassiosira exigua]